MANYLILLAPSSNRVYAAEADTLGAAELEVLLTAIGISAPIEPVTLAGIDYLQVEIDDLDPALTTLSRLSSMFALFRREGDLLLPLALAPVTVLDDDLVTIPKYQGKTNEQFTRLLVNVTVASLRRAPTGPLTILDPLCGRGTTLSTGLRYGYEVAGVDGDVKAIEAYAAFLKTYLRRKRIKHTADLNPVRRDGKSLGRRLEVEVTPEGGTKQKLTAFTGDTRQSLALFGKRRFDAIVTDAPYGVVHGSQTDVRGVSGKRDRSPAGLLGEAIGVWAQQLRAGGALGLSWNTYGLSREDLSGIAERSGLVPCNDGAYLRFSHRVDSSIQRDVFVAVKPNPVAESV